MKQGTIVRACMALTHLMDERMPIRTAYELHRLRRQLAPAWDFQAEREQAMLKEMQPERAGDNGLRFRSVEDARRWAAELAELEQMDVELDFTPVRVAMAEGMTMTPADVGALDGFVIFEE